MRPYSSVKALCWMSYTCFTGTRVLGQFGGNWTRKNPNHAQGHMKDNPKFSTPYFTSNKLLLYCLAPLRVDLYLFYRYLGIRAIW